MNNPNAKNSRDAIRIYLVTKVVQNLSQIYLTLMNKTLKLRHYALT